MEKTETKIKGNHTLLLGVNFLGIKKAVRLFNGKWYQAYIATDGMMVFETVTESYVKEMLCLFDGSFSQIDEATVDKLSSFMAKSILAHLDAKKNMEKFFSQLENSKE